MLRRGRKSVTNAVEWLLYKKLKSSYKERLSNMLTDDQKALLKRIIKPGDKRAQLKKVDRLKHRLTSLGFQEKALTDLKELYTQEEDMFLKKMAGYELLVWYANLHSEDGAQNALKIGSEMLNVEKDSDRLRKLIIMLAESYQTLGKTEAATKIIERLHKTDQHPDAILALANVQESDEKKLSWINHLYRNEGRAEIQFAENKSAEHKYDLLTTEDTTKRIATSEQSAKVSIIVPVYNAADNVDTALNSLLKQTWQNIEILVVDDCSTDETATVVKQMMELDERIKFYQTATNSGAYVARNVALSDATGKYVTINDADDWSHPEKIALQVQHLEKNAKLIGNFSNQARLSNNLDFYRRGKFGVYLFANFSSFMFRREEVMNELGYWDSVRFAGDSEYVKRIKKIFGEKALEEIDSAPMSFQRQTDDSLTGNSAFGFPGFFMGARKEYAESHEHYHESSESLKYPFPMEARPYPIPEPMKPNRSTNKEERRHYDVLIASEFRLLGGNNMSNIEEIKAQKQAGYKTGLIQLSRYDLNSVEKVNPHVRDVIDGEHVQMIVYGEKVSCDVLIVRHPPALQEWQKYVPDVEAKKVHVIVNQPPKRDYSETGETLYRFDDCLNNLKTYFDASGIWSPIGPEIRRTLEEHHSEELAGIELAEEDWVNIINVSEWKRDQYVPKQGTIRIGRHSRDQYVKWPETREQIEKVYPSTTPYEIHVLGGAKSATDVLGDLPKNWHVKQFGEEAPQDFLKNIDVFVYYTHSDWVEAFGRVMFEAMAAGVPVIIEPKYQQLFGEAAMYAEADEVKQVIEALIGDEKRYVEQVEKAQAYVENNFGYSKHIARIARDMSGK
ncbi:glycosyltransferase [Salipaludibacillus sp. HK11]|uniref:glycosyltransferase n=1 Tax=Salipaludibacillus sp. HK11 TaxID=3394320 RepID=UPI0039FBF1DB